MNKIHSLLAVTSIILFSCGQPEKSAPQEQPTVQVTATQVQRSSTVYYDKYPGTVMALQKVDLKSETSGYIREISFEEGGEVKKGKKLYTLDQRKYQATKNQAAARLKVAEANLNQAEQDANRYVALGEKDAIARQQVDVAKTTLENARQQVAAAKADLERAQTDLNYSVIEAPFDGVIGISDVRLGAYVVAGQTLLNTISSYDPMGVDVEISETEISRFMDLKNNKAVAQESSISLTLADQTTYPLSGTVAIIDRGVNAQTGTIKVRLSFPNPDKKLRDGMSVTVQVKNEHSGDNLTIPHKAVSEQMGEFFVYVIENGKAIQQKIETGKQFDDQIVVNKGLTAGQTVVVDGIQRLRNGMPVQVASANPAGPSKPVAETAK